MTWDHTYPEVSRLKVQVGDVIAGLQLFQIKGQDILDLLVVDLSEHPSTFLATQRRTNRDTRTHKHLHG
jgi:hypothetical protein